ncbi:formate dehydrogenase accessory sulfurtransferase FdhD [Massilia niastensis]|uniref:formate dehydrogenase accessory sulfurtransferase FdhD n=1 Tax=Massilia niastensis TaxID=544911 RepID=UPI0003753913|nr:formate dehydrogenase accessory sulfurtransferase FdhD [Massilia niastensis]
MNAADLLAGLAPGAACRLPASAWRDGRLEPGSELVAEEVPVALVYNGITQAVMLASPQDLEDFALGFSLGERIVCDPCELYDIEVEEAGAGIAIEMRISARAMAQLKETRRARTGRTGCGLCGVDSLSHFEQDSCVEEARAGPPAAGLLAPDALHRAVKGLAASQRLHQATGAVHAAGWADWEGQLQLVREDVGRHNALDKLVGALARAGLPAGDGFAVVTSRASFEMVQKCARAGFSVLGAISAPTALAVRMAERAGLTLAGFVRGGRHVLYSHPERLARA